MAVFDSVTEVKKYTRGFLIGESESVEEPVAYSTEDSLNLSKDDVDTSNKTDGGWGTTLGGKKSGKVSFSALCAPSNSTGYGEAAIYKAYNNDDALYFHYSYLKITEKSDGTVEMTEDTTKPYYKGRMKFSSLELTSDNGDVAKYSASATTQGAVDLVEPTSGD